MYREKSVCIVVPAYNEETQIGMVIETMPDFVDKIVIIDDCSKDNTRAVIRKYQNINKKIELIVHEKNQGVGGAIASGYKWALDNEFDIAVVMAGDGQMDPDELPSLLDPIVEDKADYAKGNRLFTGEAYRKIPKIRYFGNAFLSFLSKIASGYWHIADFQSGYTVINRNALEMIEWDDMYKRFGQPNDLLVRLNIYNFRVVDIPIEPIYNIGEKSKINIFTAIFTIGWLLFKLFLWRMKEKYIIRDFHPLVLFYMLGMTFGILTVILAVKLFMSWYAVGHIPPINALAVMFSFMSASLFSLFAMWFDMEANKDLKGDNIVFHPKRIIKTPQGKKSSESEKRISSAG